MRIHIQKLDSSISSRVAEANKKLETNLCNSSKWKDIVVAEVLKPNTSNWKKFYDLETVINTAWEGKEKDPTATFWHWAARCNNVWLVREFLKDSVACEVLMSRDGYGKTALEVAEACGSRQVADLLQLYITQNKLVAKKSAKESPPPPSVKSLTPSSSQEASLQVTQTEDASGKYQALEQTQVLAFAQVEPERQAEGLGLTDVKTGQARIVTKKVEKQKHLGIVTEPQSKHLQTLHFEEAFCKKLLQIAASQPPRVLTAKEYGLAQIEKKEQPLKIAQEKTAETSTITEGAVSEAITIPEAIQIQSVSAVLSSEETTLSIEPETQLKKKIDNIESTQLIPEFRELLTQLNEDEMEVLQRLAQSLKQQEKTLAFFQQHPVLWETYLTLITILSNQFLSAKLLHTKILDLKAKTCFKEQGIMSNTSDLMASHVTEAADLLHIPLLSGAVKGLVKIYDIESQKTTRELFNPLIEYAPTLYAQDKLIQQIAFLTIARFHELLLLAEKVDSKDLLSSFANSICDELKLSVLKQQFNDLLKREEQTEPTPDNALGALFGEFLADKLMEIILSEYEETAYQKAKKTHDFGDLILAWLRSDIWDTLPVSIAGKTQDLEATFFAKLLHVNDAKIVWDGKEPMSIVQAIRQSGFKHYQPDTQWTYKAGHEDHPETVGYLYEMDPDVFESALFQTSSQHATFSTRETKDLITTAESHYASLPVLTPTAAPVLSLQSSSSRVSPVVESTSTRVSVLEQQIQLLVEHVIKQEARIAEIEAQNKILQSEMNKQASKKEVHALEQRTNRTEDRLDQVHPAAFVPQGDGQMITIQDFANTTPAFLAFHANIQLLEAKANEALETTHKQADRLEQVEGRVETVKSRLRKTEETHSIFSWGASFFASTSASSESSDSVKTPNSNYRFFNLLKELPESGVPGVVMRLVATQRTSEAMRRAEQEIRVSKSF